MAKSKNFLFGFNTRGSIAKLLTFRRAGQKTIAESLPTHPDSKSAAQLNWRTMYEACSALWHTLSDAEKQAWESLARSKHMTGFALWQSQCLRPNPGIYLPLAGGTMSGNINMATARILALPAPATNEEPSRKIDLATHLSSDVHTQAQTPAAHGNEKHTSTFITQAEVNTHAALTTGTHGVTGTIAGTSDTQTFTNKRNQPRVSSSASGDISPDVSAADLYVRTAQAAALTINNPAGSPAQGEKLIIRLKDNATARAISWGTQYRALEFALPTTTVLIKTLYMGFIFNSTDTKWDMVAINQEA